MSKQSFFEGARKSIPIMMGYVPLGVAFGIVAKGKGLSVLQAALMSFAAFTGSGQFIAVGMLGAGASLSAILFTNLLVNMRYMLYSASMSPYVGKLPAKIQALVAFQISDETFAMNMAGFKERGTDRDFVLGINIFSHVSWILNSVIGAALGNVIPNVDKFGVGYALPAMFIALLVMQAKSKETILVAGVSALLSIVLVGLGVGGSYVILATVCAATLGVIKCQQKQKSSCSL